MKNQFIISLFIVLSILFLPNDFVNAQTDTQDLISQLQEQIKALQIQLNQMQAELKATKVELEEVKAEIRFTKILRKGMSGDEVRQLQEFLKSFSDIYPEGLVTGYFGQATERAVKKFQEQNAEDILNPSGLTQSTGIVGRATIAKLNELVQTTPAIPAIPAIPAQPVPGEGVPAVPATPAEPATPAIPQTPSIAPVVATSTATTTSITVIQPNGKEYFQKGSTYTIAWNSLNVSEVFIRLLKNNEIYTGSGGLNSGVMSNSGYYKWTVPVALPDAENYKIQVVGGGYQVSDESDYFFNIVTKAPIATPVPTPIETATTTPVAQPSVVSTSTVATSSIVIFYPNGGEYIQKGSAQTISWNSINVPTVYIKLRKGSDTYSGIEGEITNTIANTGSYQWIVPTSLTDGNDYSIRVLSGDPTIVWSSLTSSLDESDAFFSIVTTAPGVSSTPAPAATPASETATNATTSVVAETAVTATTTTDTEVVYPGFFLTTDRNNSSGGGDYTQGEAIPLTIRRVDYLYGTSPISVELYLAAPGSDKIMINSSIDVSSSAGVTIQIDTGSTEPFASGANGTYHIWVCAVGKSCASGYTNDTVVHYTAATTNPSLSFRKSINQMASILESMKAALEQMLKSF